MDDLRTRIANVLVRDSWGLTTQTAALRQADAVIRELRLRQEQRGVRPVHQLHHRQGHKPRQSRYVTEWTEIENND